MNEKKEIEIREKVVQTSLHLADTMGWDFVTLKDISKEADITLSELYDLIDDKNDILVLLGRMIDKRVIGEFSLDDSSTQREILFDLLMDRFEVLNDFRPGLIAILNYFKYDPKQALMSSPHLCRSMNWMLETAGIETGGFKGMIKVAGLTGVYLKTLKVWMEDETSDLSAVMSALDKNLGRAENMAEMFGL